MSKHDNRGIFKSRRAFARHGEIAPQKLSSAIGGLLFKGLAVVLGAVIAISGITVLNFTNTLNNNTVQLVDANGNKIKPADLKGAINVLLVGSDTRAGQAKVFGNDKSVLADVIILLHISADRKNAVALSFPRDLMVPWPACPSTSGGPGYLPQSMGQINATIANGGPGCTLLTVEKLTGVTIPYLAMINFKGVIEMSNAIGGVEVCVAKDIHDTYTFLNLTKGKHVLQGLEALQFLRTRHGVGDGSDLSRISNQQVFLTSLVRKVRSEGVLTNPVKLYSLANAAVRNMTLSSSLADLGTMVAIGGALKNIPLEKITFLQVPSRGGLPAPYSGRVMPVYEKADILFQKLANDQPLLIAKAQPGTGAVVETPAPTATPSATPSPTATEQYLDDTYRGTNGSQTTCSG
ncbi:MAG: LCP family protein [Rhodoluna sp.]|nr:LCP family protein [Rhodoluna sp.]